MDLLTALAQNGPLALVLGFVLLRLESRMTTIERAIERFGRALLVAQLSEPARNREATRLLAELDAKALG